MPDNQVSFPGRGNGLKLFSLTGRSPAWGQTTCLKANELDISHSRNTTSQCTRPTRWNACVSFHRRSPMKMTIWKMINPMNPARTQRFVRKGRLWTAPNIVYTKPTYIRVDLVLFNNVTRVEKYKVVETCRTLIVIISICINISNTIILNKTYTT